MLRLVFVVLIIAAGTFFAIQSAFYGLLFYLWNAYFRPDDWTYSGVLIPFRLSLIIGTYIVLRTILSLPNPKLNARTGLILLFRGPSCPRAVCTSENPYWSWAFFEDFVKVLSHHLPDRRPGERSQAVPARDPCDRDVAGF
jgi:hypothetical protein